MESQQVFDLSETDSREAGIESSSVQSSSHRKRLMQRALLCWLLSQEEKPAGMALDVPTRAVSYKADVAAFWNRSRSNQQEAGPSRILQPSEATLVQCYTEREECWTDCTRPDAIVPRLERLRTERRHLESVIRDTEPALRDAHTLFEEYAEWHYEKSKNVRYHALHRQIRRLEHALREGTSFEQIRNAAVADQLYLAVPEKLVEAHELTDGWGLLWIRPNLEVIVQRPAARRDCVDQHRMHLVQNIAAAATKSVLFANGITLSSKSGNPCMVQPPRGHRKRKRFTLD